MTKDEMIKAANLSQRIDDLREHLDAIAKAGAIELSCTQSSGTKLVIRTTKTFSNFVFAKVLTDIAATLDEMTQELRDLGVDP